MAFRFATLLLLFMPFGQVAGAQQVATGWAIDDHPDLLSANVCAAGDMATEASCFGVACVAGGTRFDYVVTGPMVGAPLSYRAWVIADGRRLALLTFALDDFIGLGGLYLAQTDDATKTAIGQALAVAQRVGVIPDPPLPGLARVADLPMTGGVEVLRRFGQMCFGAAQGQETGSAAPDAMAPKELTAETPATNPARFPRLEELSRHDAATEAMARQLLAGEIVKQQAFDPTGPAIEVNGYLLAFADGRQVMIVTLCQPTIFGRTGCASYYFLASAAGQPFVKNPQDFIGGGPFWLDLQDFAGGFPRIVGQPFQLNGGYASAPLWHQ